jgi:hypothetical protein
MKRLFNKPKPVMMFSYSHFRRREERRYVRWIWILGSVLGAVLLGIFLMG